MKILSIVGARPNFMKLAPVATALRQHASVEHVVVNTGQHYDDAMSSRFFQELGVPAPKYQLNVGSGTHAGQTAAAMTRLEPVIQTETPDWVVVYGDVNSTLAGALVAAKLGRRVAHVEAGLRSGDRSMPEEINRIITDRISDVLFAPSPDAIANLRAEGVPRGRIHFVGNVMIDILVRVLPKALSEQYPDLHGIGTTPYVLATLHRPSNVDDPERLRDLIGVLEEVSTQMPVLFPAHPRTARQLRESGFAAAGNADLRILDPLGYTEMLGLTAGARLVITDSGGMQEETTFLGVPCLTVRANTERPITCLLGTNRLVDPERNALRSAVRRALAIPPQSFRPKIDRWDGHTAERIAAVLCENATYLAELDTRGLYPTPADGVKASVAVA